MKAKTRKPLIECDHKCHKVGLNPWVLECPICGCENPVYDGSQPPSSFEELLSRGGRDD